MEYVYAFRYSSCTHEERMCVISLHVRKDDAKAAMEAHKKKRKFDWEGLFSDDMFMDEEELKYYKKWRSEHPWSDADGSGSERWDVVRMEVQK